MKTLAVFILGICATLFAVSAFEQRENRLAERTYTCKSGDTFWTEKKWNCTAEEWRQQQPPTPASHPQPASAGD